jgi:hypothetical protein
LFNSSLEGKVGRAIDIREGDKLNEAALKDLIRAAVALNLKAKVPSAAGEASPPLGRQPSDREGRRRRPGQAYIAAMPGWKRDVGRRLDTLMVRTVPQLPLRHEVREGGFLPRHVAAFCPARQIQARGRALPTL